MQLNRAVVVYDDRVTDVPRVGMPSITIAQTAQAGRAIVERSDHVRVSRPGFNHLFGRWLTEDRVVGQVASGRFSG